MNMCQRVNASPGQSKRPVKPLPRHAELAVNMAGSMASFLLATFEAKRGKRQKYSFLTLTKRTPIPTWFP
jgi:hypothetical protein